MEAPQKIVLPEDVSSFFYCALGSALFRPVRRFGVLDYKIQSGVKFIL
jgi:hypothetical protein